MPNSNPNFVPAVFQAAISLQWQLQVFLQNSPYPFPPFIRPALTAALLQSTLLEAILRTLYTASTANPGTPDSGRTSQQQTYLQPGALSLQWVPVLEILETPIPSFFPPAVAL